MVDTPSPKPKNGTAPPPFKRGQIVWGRPPQQLFRVGPPPRAPGTAPAPAAGQTQRRPAGAGILTGSMIPGQTATPAQVAPLPPVTQTTPVPTPSIQPAPLPPVERPAALEPEPVRAPVAAASEPTLAPVPETLISDAPIVPSYATAMRPRSGVPVAAWIVGGLVAVALAGVGWWLLKPDTPAPAVEATKPLVPEQTTPAVVPAPVEAVQVVEEPAETTVEAAPVTRPTTAAATATPAPTRATPAPTATAPSSTPRLNTEPTVPRIETAPLVVAPVAPPPTAAERPAADPDAPIQTRPQPLN